MLLRMRSVFVRMRCIFSNVIEDEAAIP